MHAVLFVIGSLLIAAATLLYSTEEKRLQNRIEDLWLLASELRPTSETWLTAIVAAAASVVLRIIDRSFGKNLISFSAFASAIITSTYSLVMIIVIMDLQIFDPKTRLEVAVIATIATGLTVWFEKTRIPAAALVIGYTALISTTFGTGFMVLTPLYAGAATDICTILLIRALLQWLLTLKTFQAATILLLLHAGLLAFTLAPIVVTSSSTSPLFLLRWKNTLFYTNAWAFSNAFVVIVATALTAVLLLMAIHRVLWPLIERALYRIASFGIFEHRKVLFTTGVALICASSTSVAAVVGTLRKIFGL